MSRLLAIALMFIGLVAFSACAPKVEEPEPTAPLTNDPADGGVAKPMTAQPAAAAPEPRAGE